MMFFYKFRVSLFTLNQLSRSFKQLLARGC